MNVTAGSWLKVSEYNDRTTANSSATLPICGNSSEISVPLWPCFRNDQEEPLTFGSLVLIIANSWFLIIFAGIDCPSSFVSKGLGSYVSTCEGPPDMKRLMTLLARGAKCGPSWLVIAFSRSIQPKAKPPKPPAARPKNARRVWAARKSD